VCGTVEQGGKLLAGAAIQLRGANPAWARTDAHGRYLSVGLVAGDYDLLAHDAEQSPRRVHVVDGAIIRDVRLFRPPPGPGMLAGVVVDGRGAPVVGVTVIAGAGAAVTGDDGSFVVRGLWPDLHVIEVRVGGVRGMALELVAHGTHLFNGPPYVELGEGGHLDGVRLQVDDVRHTIRGHVDDPDGHAQAGVTIVAARRIPEYGCLRSGVLNFGYDPGFHAPLGAISTASGDFEIHGLPADDYLLYAVGPTGDEVVVTGVKAGDSSVAIRLVAAGSIVANVSGFTEPVQIVAMHMHPRPPVSARGGRFGAPGIPLDGLPVGRYLVAALGEHESAYAVVDVESGKTVTAELVSAGLGSLEGRVVDFETGAGIAGMRCHAGLESGPRWEDERVATDDDLAAMDGAMTSTDADGRFSLSMLPAGRVVVECRSPFWDLESTGAFLTLRPDELARVELPTVATDLRSSGMSFRLDGGTTVEWVVAGGGASLAGLQVGDVVLEVDGKSVEGLTGATVERLARRRPPGSYVVLTVRRGSAALSIQIALQAW
jgi:hypothetical protein